jgi:hypothetical protein
MLRFFRSSVGPARFLVSANLELNYLHINHVLFASFFLKPSYSLERIAA